VHDVGNVNNGVGAAPLGHVEPVDVPLKLKQLPRNESWLGSAGTPHNVTEIPVNGNNVDTFADVVLNPYPEPVFTVTSNIEFANKTFAPNCAGSPAGGTTLYKGTEIPPLLILIVRIPTWDAIGHGVPEPNPLWLNSEIGHRGAAFGLPINPGGKLTTTSFTLSVGLPVESVLNPTFVTISHGCEPACVAADPSGLIT
jgi:hypothetical protein